MFSWHTLGLLVQINHHLNATDIVADHVNPVMRTVYLSQTGSMCMTVTSVYFSDLSLLPDLNTIQNLWNAVQNPKEMCYAVLYLK